MATQAAVIAIGTAVAAEFGLLMAATPAQVHVGRAKVIVQDVQGKIGEQPPAAISVNQPLFFKQRVLTTGASRGVVEFRDGSILQVGPNAIVTLDRFVFNPFESKSEKVITAVSGAFRYISGMKTKTSSLEIRTASATIGIRGSLADFLVHPSIPTFVSMGDGVATVRNDSDTREVQAGQSIAVQSRTESFAPAEQIPPAVAVEALQHIQNQVGTAPAPDSLPPLTQAEAQADAAANELPADQQASGQATPPDAVPVQAVATAGPPPPVGLLVQAGQVGLLQARGNAPLTPAQQTFVNSANAAIPDAAQQLQSSATAAKAETRSNGNRSIQTIVKAAAQFTQGAGKVALMVSASAQADTAGAVLIASAALEGAPTQGVEIAAAAANGAPGEAAAIAGGMAKSRPDLAAAISVVIVNANKGAASAVVAAVAQNVPAAQAAEALSAVSSVVPEQATDLIASVASVSPEAATQALSDISTAAGNSGDTNSGSNNSDGGGSNDQSDDGGGGTSESQVIGQSGTTS